jgi:hypothetical protein
MELGRLARRLLLSYRVDGRSPGLLRAAAGGPPRGYWAKKEPCKLVSRFALSKPMIRWMSELPSKEAIKLTCRRLSAKSFNKHERPAWRAGLR